MKYRSFVMRRNGIMSLLVIGMLSFRGVCLAQNDSLRMDSIIHALPEVMVKGIRPIAKVERGKLIYNMPLLLQSMGADNALDAHTGRGRPEWRHYVRRKERNTDHRW